MAGIFLTPIISKPQRQEESWLNYAGNFKHKHSFPAIKMVKNTDIYIVHLEASQSNTVTISIDSSKYGFTESIKGGQIQILFTLPDDSEDIPTISFSSNIRYADFEEIDRYVAGKTYLFNLITSNGGVNWVIAETEEY